MKKLIKYIFPVSISLFLIIIFVLLLISNHKQNVKIKALEATVVEMKTSIDGNGDKTLNSATNTALAICEIRESIMAVVVTMGYTLSEYDIALDSTLSDKIFAKNTPYSKLCEEIE